MADVGARIEVRGVGTPRNGVVTAASGTMLTVLWDTGEETSFIPGAGDLTVVPSRRPTSKATTKKAPARKGSAKKAVTAKSTAKKSPARKTASKKATGRKTIAKKTSARKTATKTATAKSTAK